MGALGDIWLPAAAGIGRGVSQGIQDYGNVSRIRREEELAPIQRGVLQQQLDEGALKLKQAQDEEKRQNTYVAYKELPHYQNLSPESKAYFDSVMAGKESTVRGINQAVKQASETSLGMKVIGEATLSSIAPKVTAVQQEQSVQEEALSKIQPTITDTFGRTYNNPEYEKQAEVVNAAREKTKQVVTQFHNVEGNVEKSTVRLAAQEMSNDYKDIVAKNPGLRLMLKLVGDTGDKAALDKTLEIFTKVKENKITNLDEAIIAKYIKPDGTLDASGLNKAVGEMKQYRIENIKEKGAQAQATKATPSGTQTQKDKDKQYVDDKGKPLIRVKDVDGNPTEEYKHPDGTAYNGAVTFMTKASSGGNKKTAPATNRGGSGSGKSELQDLMKAAGIK